MGNEARRRMPRRLASTRAPSAARAAPAMGTASRTGRRRRLAAPGGALSTSPVWLISTKPPVGSTAQVPPRDLKQPEEAALVGRWQGLAAGTVVDRSHQQALLTGRDQLAGRGPQAVEGQALRVGR